MGEDWRCEGRGRGRDLGVDGDEEEERFGHVGPHLGRPARGRNPAWGGNSVMDESRETGDCGLRVGIKDPGLNLGDPVADFLIFVGEFNGKTGFKLVD